MAHDYCITKRKTVKIDGKIIGEIRGNRFIKSVIGSRHQLRQPPVWCLSKDIFEREIRPRITEIHIRDKEAGIVYKTSVNNFLRHCFEIQRGSFEKQLALTLGHWQIHGDGHKQLTLWEGGNNGDS